MGDNPDLKNVSIIFWWGIHEISKLYLKKIERSHERKDGRTNKPKAVCPFNFYKVGGITIARFPLDRCLRYTNEWIYKT